MATIEELKDFQAKLAEVERLPLMEAQAAEEKRRQEITQYLNQSEFDLEALAAQCNLVEAEIVSNLRSMIEQIDQALGDLARLQQLYNRANDLARFVAQARCQLGQQSVKHTGPVTQADVDHEASITLERNGLAGQSRLANVGQTLATLREQLTGPRPPDVLTGKVQIKRHIDGRDVEFWG